MMVPGQVQVSIAVYDQADAVMRIADISFETGPDQLPGSAIKLSLTQYHKTFGVIEAGELMVLIACNRIFPEYDGIDSVAGPAFCEVHYGNGLAVRCTEEEENEQESGNFF